MLQIKLDMHVHTYHSKDAFTTIGEAVDSARKKGLHGIALTNHDSLVRVDDSKFIDFLLIPGIEVSSKDGHILALGVSHTISKGMSAAETIRTTREFGGVAVIAHPGSRLENGVPKEKISELAPDGLEVMNSLSFPFKLVTQRSVAIAKRYGLAEVGGSDSHIPKTVGNVYTVVETPSCRLHDVLESIRRGRTTPMGRGTTINERIEKLWRQLASLANPIEKRRRELAGSEIL